MSVCVSERECVREYVLQNFLKSILSRIYANRKASWQPGEACGMRHVAGSRRVKSGTQRTRLIPE